MGVALTCEGDRANNEGVGRILGTLDGDLLGVVVPGDSEAFAVICRRYLPRVVGLLVRQTHDREAQLLPEVTGVGSHTAC